MSDHISVLSNQNGDLVGHMSFQGKKIICSPVIHVENEKVKLVITSLSFTMEVHCNHMKKTIPIYIF